MAAQARAQVAPSYLDVRGLAYSAKLEVSYTPLNRKGPEFIRFVKPGEIRIAREACSACHLSIIQAQERSLMASGAMLWGGGAYNNGILVDGCRNPHIDGE